MPAGYALHPFDSIDSTNAEALRRIAGGAAGGDVIWAASQSGGRGRRGRSWESPPGNLYMTVIVPAPPGASVGQLAFVAANGAGDAVRGLLASPRLLRYKWPNDLMLEGQKLGGILIEAGSGQPSPAVAVGIGLNVESGPPGLNAVALRDFGVEVSVRDLLTSVCRSFDRWYRVWREDGFAPVREQWLGSAHELGDNITVRFPDGAEIDGLYGGIDRDGALILERPGGKSESIATGEVFLATA